jgi:hypothetical protein
VNTEREGRAVVKTMPGSGTVVEARQRLGMYLRAGRGSKKLSIEDVARITKIPPRILEKLEVGALDGAGLPADVFVKGFVRSFARCVGLDEAEAVERFTAAREAAPVAKVESTPEVVVVRPSVPANVVREMSDISDDTSSELPVVEAAPASTRKRRKKDRSRKRRLAQGTLPEPTPVVAAEAVPTEVIASGTDATAAIASGSDATEVPASGEIIDSTIAVEASSATHGTWKPTMPPLSATPSVPWRRPTLPVATLPAAPSLVIDDADPDRAEREQEERASTREPHRVSFLPPILLDREDRSARQGGLTLAVIILLIAATLTLSYLMRRPSVSGDGVTMRDTPATLST